VILTTRVALPDDLPNGTRIIDVAPLPAAEAVALARAVAAPAALSSAVERLVVDRAGGNPLFIEQLIARLSEEGLLGASDSRLRSISLPVSLYGVFLERVDRLESPLADALRLASVLGVEFESEVYRRVSERAAPRTAADVSRWTAAAALTELAARGFLAHRESPDGDLFAFEAPAMQAAVFGTVLAENRRILHALAAETLEEVYAGRLPRQFARILHHYTQSANIAQTVRYARLAGERALLMAAYDEAAEHLGIAASLQERLPDVSPLDAAEALHRLAMALEWKGQLREAAARVEQAAARLAGDTPPSDRSWIERRALIAVTAGELYGLLGAPQRSIDAYADAERWFAAIDLVVDAAEARCCRGFGQRPLGQWARGVELASEGWAVLEQTANLPAIARAGHELGNLLRDLGRYEESIRIFDRAIASGDALRREGRLSESMWGSIAARSGRAMTYAATGNLSAAIDDQRAANDLARRDGNRVAEAISEYHLATHYLELGDLVTAEARAERAYRQAREMDMPGRAVKCRLVQARACICGDRWEQALQRINDVFADPDQRRIPDDALVTAVDLLASAVHRVPQPALAHAARLAWPFLTQGGGNERLRHARTALEPLLALEDDVTRSPEQTGE
jgi:tetratricopeptide (TPR) repeat protein